MGRSIEPTATSMTRLPDATGEQVPREVDGALVTGVTGVLVVESAES
jgi:hypothetical protein